MGQSQRQDQHSQVLVLLLVAMVVVALLAGAVARSGRGPPRGRPAMKPFDPGCGGQLPVALGAGAGDLLGFALGVVVTVPSCW